MGDKKIPEMGLGAPDIREARAGSCELGSAPWETAGILRAMVLGDQEGKSGIVPPGGRERRREKGASYARPQETGVECPYCPAELWNLTGRWLQGRALSSQGASAVPAALTLAGPEGLPAGSATNPSPSLGAPGLARPGLLRDHWVAPCPRPTSLNQARAPNFVPAARGKIGFTFFSISKNGKQTNQKIFALEKYLFDVVCCLNCPRKFFFNFICKRERKLMRFPNLDSL